MKIVILGIQRLQQLQSVSFHAKTFAQNALNTWLRHLQFPSHTMCWLLRAPDKRFSHMLDSLGWWSRPACSFPSAHAVTLLEFHAPLTNCFVRMWFCAVHSPKPPLHRHNWLSFGKFQETERFLILRSRHVSSRLPPSNEICKYTTAPSTKKPPPPPPPWRDSLPVDMLRSAVSVLVIAQPSLEIPEGLMNYPVFFYVFYVTWALHYIRQYIRPFFSQCDVRWPVIRKLISMIHNQTIRVLHKKCGSM